MMDIVIAIIVFLLVLPIVSPVLIVVGLKFFEVVTDLLWRD